jgi:hypothetical protein
MTKAEYTLAASSEDDDGRSPAGLLRSSKRRHLVRAPCSNVPLGDLKLNPEILADSSLDNQRRLALACPLEIRLESLARSKSSTFSRSRSIHSVRPFYALA